jgi:hypothetical protein
VSFCKKIITKGFDMTRFVRRSTLHKPLREVSASQSHCSPQRRPSTFCRSTERKWRLGETGETEGGAPKYVGEGGGLELITVGSVDLTAGVGMAFEEQVPAGPGKAIDHDRALENIRRQSTNVQSQTVDDVS